MKLSDFDFDLPDGLIATRPARPRTAARLLVAGPSAVRDATVDDLPGYLLPGDRLILNDTRVIPARLNGVRRRESTQGPVEAKIEITLMEPTTDGHWQALVKPLRKINAGEVVHFSAGFHAVVVSKSDGRAELAFNLTGDAFDTALAAVGAMPLPPYIAAKRPADEADNDDYQTVWADRPGAVAAPTASLHFDETLLQTLADKGVSFTHVTLHVGAGTFLPVKTDNVADHKMHAEWGEVSAAAADEINQTVAAGGRIIPVGTTALRLIETAAVAPGKIAPWQGDTDIFIRPGYQFQLTNALMTNFHLPKSTLLMLVAALMGKSRMADVYDHAIAQGYRFFSYGDASLLLPGAQKRQD